MFANTLRASARHVIALTKPRRAASTRFIRPSFAAAIPTSSVFCRTFIQSHVAQDDRKVVYFGNLPWAVEMGEVKDAAERFGTLEQITMPNGPDGRFAGFANVVFARAEDANACFEHAKSEGVQVGGRRSMLHLLEEPREEPLPRYGVLNPRGKNSSSPTKTLFVSNIPFDMEREDLEEMFSPFGQIARVNVGRRNDGRNLGWAHVEYTDMEMAMKVVETHQQDPLMVRDRTVIIDFARDGRRPYHKLFFSGYHGSIDHMRSLLENHNVGFIKILRDRETSRPSGTGFLEFETIDEATEALRFIREDLKEFRAEYAIDPAEKFRDGRAQTAERGPASRSTYGGDWGGGSRNSGYAS